MPVHPVGPNSCAILLVVACHLFTTNLKLKIGMLRWARLEFLSMSTYARRNFRSRFCGKEERFVNLDHIVASGDMAERRGYTFFDYEDAGLEIISEYDEDDYLEEGEDDEISEDQVKAVKSNTEKLVAAAEEEMSDLNLLLGKLKTGAATRVEKERLKSFHGKLSGMKKDVEISKHRESETGMKMLKTITRTKTMDLKKAIKDKKIRSIVRSVCAAESVDLAFLVDCMGSMSGHIASVKANICEIFIESREPTGISSSVLQWWDTEISAMVTSSLRFLTSFRL